jgi:hypothetical protein
MTRQYRLTIGGARGRHVWGDFAVRRVRQEATAVTKPDESREGVAVLGCPFLHRYR